MLRSVHWVLQDSLASEAGFAPILATLERLELPYSVHQVVPFIGELLARAGPT